MLDNKIVESYKDYLLVNGASYSTISGYINRVKLIFANMDLETLDAEKIQKYFVSLQGKKFEPSTINAYRDTLKSFLIFCKKDIPIPKHLKIDNKIPDYMLEKDFKQEIVPVFECMSKNPLKIKAILYFLFYTGIRISEIDTLKRCNIDLELKRAKIYVKKRREERLICFTDEVKTLLVQYFDSEPEKENAFNTSSDTLKRYFGRMKKYIKQLNFHAHSLRHGFAINALRKGLDISIIQRLLGHKDISTTVRYLNCSIDVVQEKYEQYLNKNSK